MESQVIGQYIPGADGRPGHITRGWSGQGWIYKNPEAFYYRPRQVCYIPEQSDGLYTGENFLGLSLGQPEIAREIFQSVAWQEPETWLDDQFARGELSICRSCGRIYQSYGNAVCPCRNGGGRPLEAAALGTPHSNRTTSNQQPGTFGGKRDDNGPTRIDDGGTDRRGTQ